MRIGPAIKPVRSSRHRNSAQYALLGKQVQIAVDGAKADIRFLFADPEANLMAAFAGESQATNKYTYYASKAKKETVYWLFPFCGAGRKAGPAASVEKPNNPERTKRQEVILMRTRLSRLPSNSK